MADKVWRMMVAPLSVSEVVENGGDPVPWDIPPSTPPVPSIPPGEVVDEKIPVEVGALAEDVVDVPKGDIDVVPKTDGVPVDGAIDPKMDVG